MMNALFLAPHNDDETLFGAFSILRYKPHVVVVLLSQAQAERGTGITAEIRMRETQDALEQLDTCWLVNGEIGGRSTWEQWDFPDTNPDWDAVATRMVEVARLGFERIFAPMWHPQGNEQHNVVALLADEAFGHARVTHYTTYHDHRVRTEGVHVPYEPEWVLLKLRALACYESQAVYGPTAHHFLAAHHEWYGEPLE